MSKTKKQMRTLREVTLPMFHTIAPGPGSITQSQLDYFLDWPASSACPMDIVNAWDRATAMLEHYADISNEMRQSIIHAAQYQAVVYALG